MLNELKRKVYQKAEAAVKRAEASPMTIIEELGVKIMFVREGVWFVKDMGAPSATTAYDATRIAKSWMMDTIKSKFDSPEEALASIKS